MLCHLAYLLTAFAESSDFHSPRLPEPVYAFATLVGAIFNTLGAC
jgi:hypothetical protein